MKPKVSLGLKLDTTVQVTDADIQSPRHQVPEEYQKISGKTNENDDDGDQQEKSSDKDNTQDSRSELNRLPGDDAPFKPRELSTVQPHNDEVTVQPIISDPVEKPKVVEAVAIPKDEGSKVEVVAPPLPNLITQVAKEQPVATPAVTKQKQSFWSRLCCCAAEEEPIQKEIAPIVVPPVKPATVSDIKLLPPPSTTKKCLVLDLDETLVHSSFKPVEVSDFTIQVEIENHVYTVYVLKRPGVEEFLEKVSEWFEVVVFTASLAKVNLCLISMLIRFLTGSIQTITYHIAYLENRVFSIVETTSRYNYS